MEEERIKTFKKWPKPESVRDIKIFIDFINFYRYFIKGFSRIAVPPTAMLNTTGSSITSASRVDDDEVVGIRDAVGRSDVSRKLAKSKSRTRSGNNLEKPKFLTSKAKKAFNHLRQVFTKALILRHFDPKCHIRIKTNASGYAIRGVPSQLTLNPVTSDKQLSQMLTGIQWPISSEKSFLLSCSTRLTTMSS